MWADEIYSGGGNFGLVVLEISLSTISTYADLGNWPDKDAKRAY